MSDLTPLIPLVFGGGFLLTIASLRLAWANRRREALLASWDALAASYQGRVLQRRGPERSPRDALQITLDGVELCVDLIARRPSFKPIRRRSAGIPAPPAARPIQRVTALVPRGWTYGLHITKRSHDRWDPRPIPSWPIVATGDERFDAAFIVRSDDSERGRAFLLQNPALREAHLRSPELTLLMTPDCAGRLARGGLNDQQTRLLTQRLAQESLATGELPRALTRVQEDDGVLSLSWLSQAIHPASLELAARYARAAFTWAPSASPADQRADLRADQADQVVLCFDAAASSSPQAASAYAAQPAARAEPR